MKVKIEISARHVHLCKKDLETLFGKNYNLRAEKKLSQPGQFASQAKVTLIGKKRKIEDVAVVGPLRERTQVEISRTDAFYLGAEAPLRISGDIKDSGSIKLSGPKGEVDLPKGLIVAKRHIHVSPAQAKELGVKKGRTVKAAVSGERALVFDEIAVRVDENYDLSVQVDTDEGNAAGLPPVGKCELIVE